MGENIMNKIKYKKLVLVTAMLMATLLTACGSNKVETPASEADITKVETPRQEAEESVEQDEVEEVAASEPAPENTKFAGIDMESTLPGLEWMATFDNIVDEIVIVVYNDETNKKVIVEEGDEVEFSKSSDILATYTPNAETIPIIATPGGFDECWEGGNELQDSLTAKRGILCKKGATSGDESQKCTVLTICDGEEKTYKFTLKFVE